MFGSFPGTCVVLRHRSSKRSPRAFVCSKRRHGDGEMGWQEEDEGTHLVGFILIGFKSKDFTKPLKCCVVLAKGHSWIQLHASDTPPTRHRRASAEPPTRHRRATDAPPTRQSARVHLHPTTTFPLRQKQVMQHSAGAFVSHIWHRH